MINIKKLIGLAASAVIAVSSFCISAFADDFSFDMQKAKPTYGGGQAYMTFTRLDNEKRDKNNFNPLWITEDSQIEIEYTTEGDYEETPIYFVFQSWTGEIVSSQKDKWVLIAPTTFDDTKAVWDYETIINTYGSNFSDVYAFVVTDGGENALTVSSITITNIKIAKDEILTVSGGTVITDEPIEMTEQSVSETVVSDSNDTSAESSDKTTIVASEQTEKNIEDNDTNKSINWYLVGIIVSGAMIAVLTALLIIKTIKAKTKGWR